MVRWDVEEEKVGLNRGGLRTQLLLISICSSLLVGKSMWCTCITMKTIHMMRFVQLSVGHCDVVILLPRSKKWLVIEVYHKLY